VGRWQRLRRRLFPRRPVRTRAVQTITDIASPQLGNTHNVTIYLPPSYDGSNRHYPVVYMQDGQNLFDRATSHAGDWGLVDRLDAIAPAGVEAIIAGVWNAGDARLAEYSRFVDRAHGGGAGDRYLAFLVETLKPLIDARFQTRPEPATTGIAGSSMGGLISLTAFLSRPDVFGFAAVMSPSLWFADAAAIPFVEQSPKPGGPLYLDVGCREGDRALADVRRLRTTLLGKGYREGVDLMYEEDAGGEHNEAAWGRRFPRALTFLLSERSGA
jgi:predicted alpha/beta superfamily hydrolase